MNNEIIITYPDGTTYKLSELQADIDESRKKGYTQWDFSFSNFTVQALVNKIEALHAEVYKPTTDRLFIQEVINDLKAHGYVEGGKADTMLTHYKMSDNKKETQFREWLDEVQAEFTNVPAGTFKESGTNIATVLITIDKPL